MTAILFGSISTLADTSELQRRAFNDAFAQHDLGWEWDRDTYRSLLDSNGGAQRIAAYAADRGERVDADAVHATKSTRFRELLADGGVTARPGVAATIRAAVDRGVDVAVVTTTSAENVAALLAALDGEIPTGSLRPVLDVSHVAAGKPDPEVYEVALRELGVVPRNVVCRVRASRLIRRRTSKREALVEHRRAKLSIEGRRLLIERIRFSGWPVARAAEAQGVSRATAHKWLRRYDGVYHPYDEPGPYGAAFLRIADPGATERFRRTAEEHVAKAAASLQVEVPVRTKVLAGPPAKVLVQRTSDTDLLVVGRHGLDGEGTPHLGSVARQVLHHATSPVAIVPGPG